MIRGAARRLARLAAIPWLVTAALSGAPAQAQTAAPELPPVGVSPTAPPLAPPITSALALGVTAGPAIDTLDLAKADLALISFRESCPRLLKRTDVSGLTKPEDWAQVCALAANWPEPDATRFFSLWFETAVAGDGKTFVTGYYEPEIAGVRTREPGFDVPVYAMPPDLVRAWPADLPEEQRTGQAPLGRFDEMGVFVPYYDRAAIEDGALVGKNLEIAWAADPIEFFFLQIQGSGRLRAPDGTVMRIGYAGQNGRDYVAIGSLMRERGLIGEGATRWRRGSWNSIAAC